MAEDYRRRVVEQYLLHLDDELAALRGVELDCEPVAQRVELRVAVSASVLRVASVYVRLPVLVDEDLGVSGLRRKDIRDKQVVFAAYPDAVEDVVVDVLEVYLYAHVLSVGLGRLSEERQLGASAVEDEFKFEGFAVLIDVAVAVRVLPARLGEKLLRSLGIVAVGIFESVEAVIHRRRDRRTAGNECTFKQHLTICLTVKSREQRLTDALVMQRTPLRTVEPRENVAERRYRADVESLFVGEERKVAWRDVDRHVYLAGLERHRARVRVVYRRYLDYVVGNLAVPVVRVALHYGLGFAVFLNHVRPGAYRPFLGVVAVLHVRVDDYEKRVAEHSGQRRHWALRLDVKRLPVGADFVVFEHRLRARGLLEGALNRLLRVHRGHLLAV